jgi:hypothetical protein
MSWAALAGNGEMTRRTIDAELRLLAPARQSIREQGDEPGSRQVDELLDERAKSEN